MDNSHIETAGRGKKFHTARVIRVRKIVGGTRRLKEGEMRISLIMWQPRSTWHKHEAEEDLCHCDADTRLRATAAQRHKRSDANFFKSSWFIRRRGKDNLLRSRTDGKNFKMAVGIVWPSIVYLFDVLYLIFFSLVLFFFPEQHRLCVHLKYDSLTWSQWC